MNKAIKAAIRALFREIENQTVQVTASGYATGASTKEVLTLSGATITLKIEDLDYGIPIGVKLLLPGEIVLTTTAFAAESRGRRVLSFLEGHDVGPVTVFASLTINTYSDEICRGYIEPEMLPEIPQTIIIDLNDIKSPRKCGSCGGVIKDTEVGECPTCERPVCDECFTKGRQCLCICGR